MSILDLLKENKLMVATTLPKKGGVISKLKGLIKNYRQRRKKYRNLPRLG